MTMAAPLLHVTQAVSTARTVDGWIVAAGILAAIVLSVAIWRSAGRLAIAAMRRRSVRRRGFAAVAAALMTLAVSPAVFPYDHLFAEPHDGQHESVHAAHCHGDPGSCADAPVTAGPGELMTGAPLIVVPSLLAVMIVIGLSSLSGTSVRPILRPPVLKLALRSA